MSLQITMIKAPGSVAASRKIHTFDGSGGTIGRGANNDLVLQDPDRFLSSQHCQIFCDVGHFFIIDLSTNGTFVNGSPEPLGKGGKAPLSHGDTFEIGDYVFEVEQAGEVTYSASPFETTAEPASSSDDFFSSSYSPVDSSDPFGASDFQGQDFGVLPDEETSDPLAALDRAQSGGTQSPSVPDPFTAASDRSPFSGSSYSDQANVMNEAVAWPEASTQNLIPEEWEDDLGLEPAPPSADVFHQSEVRAPVAPVHEVPVQRKPAAFIPDSEDRIDALDRQAGADEEVAAPKTQPDVAPPAVPSRSAPVAPEQPAAVSQRLLQGMGLDTDKLSAEQMEQIAGEVGALMREVVGGMMQVLRSRSSIKNEFRMNVTTIQPVENNPLKFSADVDEALDNMFVRRSNAYKGPVDAIQEGFQEIGEHQLAMIAGIRHGFEQMMKRFDPQALEMNFDKQGGGVLPGMKKSKYWSGYHEYYKNFTDNMEHSFQHLFGSEFVHAYEDQLRKLKMGRKKTT